jgi:hypothetical protein
MGSISFRLPAGAIPSEVFKDIPKGARTFLRRGFVVLNRVFPKYSEALLSLPADLLATNAQRDPADIASRLGIPVEDARNLLGTMSFLALIASSAEPEPLSKTTAALVEAELLEATGKQPAEAVLAHFQQERTKVGSAFRKTTLSSRLLPSLTSLDFVVDVRVDFDREEVGVAVPVVLAHLDTDAVHQELWFQMSRPQVENVLEDLKKVLSRLEQAEKWAQTRSLT